MIKKEELVGYKKGDDFRSVVLEDILGILSKRAKIHITETLSKEVNKTASSSTIDLQAYEIMRIFFNKNINQLTATAPVQRKNNLVIIKPFYLLLDEEVLLYAKLKKLKFKLKQEKKDKITNFIDGLEKKHPEIKRAIVNGLLNV